MTHVYRTPVAGLAVIFMAMFVGLMQAGLYSKVGREKNGHVPCKTVTSTSDC